MVDSDLMLFCFLTGSPTAINDCFKSFIYTVSHVLYVKV